MQLTLKQYQIVRLIIVIVLAACFSNLIVLKNYFLPIALLILASLVLMYLRKKVKGVIADERDYQIGGKAALLAMQVCSWIGVVAMFVFYAFSDTNPFYQPIAMTLAFSICILMLVYSVIFRYYERIKFSDKKLIFSVIIFILFLVLAVFSLRIFSGEDNWICKNGEWVEHGHPFFPAPTVECK